jgi:hypothetical protein
MSDSGVSAETLSSSAERLMNKDAVSDSEVAVMFGTSGLGLPFRVNLAVRRRLSTLVSGRSFKPCLRM